MNSPEYCEKLPITNEFAEISQTLTKNEWYLPEYWENLPRMIELTRILGKVTKNEWTDLSIGKTYQVNK